jgi:hypothetical protein
VGYRRTTKQNVLTTLASESGFEVGGVGQIGEIAMSDAAQLGANHVRGKAGAKQAAVKRRNLAFTERAAHVRQLPAQARANRRRFVRFREDGIECGLDVAIGHAAAAQLSRDAEASLAARLRVLARVFEREASIVEITLLAKARNDRGNGFFVVSSSF